MVYCRASDYPQMVRAYMKIILILLSIIFGLLGIFLSIRREQERKKPFWFGLLAIIISIGILISQNVNLQRNALEK